MLDNLNIGPLNPIVEPEQNIVAIRTFGPLNPVVEPEQNIVDKSEQYLAYLGFYLLLDLVHRPICSTSYISLGLWFIWSYNMVPFRVSIIFLPVAVSTGGGVGTYGSAAWITIWSARTTLGRGSLGASLRGSRCSFRGSFLPFELPGRWSGSTPAPKWNTKHSKKNC